MIIRVEIYFDDDVPEYMDGIYRLGSVTSFYRKDESEADDEYEINHQELINNDEFHSAYEAIEFVALKLNVDKSIIECPEVDNYNDYDDCGDYGAYK